MNVPLLRRWIALAGAWLSLVLPLFAQGEAQAEFFARRDGNDVRAAIRVAITPGWHLYHDELGPTDAVGKPTTVKFKGDGFTWSEVRFPQPLRLEQPGLGADGGDTWIWGHEGTIVLYARATATTEAKLEDIELVLKGLTCEDEGSCIPYAETLRVAGKGDDALFTAFPNELAAPTPRDETPVVAPTESSAKSSVAPSEPAASGQSGGKTEFGKPFGRVPGVSGFGRGGQRASAKLYLRQQGADVRAVIEVTVQPTYHLYHDELGPPDATGKPTVVDFDGEGLEWSDTRFPKPHRLEQPGTGDDGRDTWIWGHDGIVVLYTRGRAADGATLDDVTAKIVGLTCTDGGECVPYSETLAPAGAGPDALFAAFPEDLAVGEGGGERGVTPSVAAEDGERAESSSSDIDWDAVTFRDYQPRADTEQKSLLMWLVFAFIAGALLNVMPCVLPVVSIKVLSFVKQAGESRSRIFSLGVAFSAGILVVFLVLAALAAFANQGWGQQFQNETFKVVMIAIVFGFALSLFDVYELGVPSKVGEIAAVKREGLVDAFFKGIMATLLATPCSGPFLGSTLAWALSQEPLVVFAIFTSCGLGMAAPYALLTSNPAFLKFVPKPGAWMKTFKHLMGFLLMGTVIFLMVSVRQDLLLFTATLLVFVALGCWWWGTFATFEQTPIKKFGTFVVAAGIVALGAWFSFGTMRGWYAPVDSEWEEFDPIALERYHSEGRNVFVDFTANWCLTCKANEKFVYNTPEIRRRFAERGFAVVKADETGDSPRTAAIRRLREQLGARSIPFMAIFPGDDPTRPMTLKDVVKPSELDALIDACPTP